jgi:glucose-6-phosphate 1-dehydrogenase
MTMAMDTVDLDFSFQESFGGYRPDAYERLLADALLGDPSLFLHQEEIEAAWQFIDPILEGWRDHPEERLPIYPAGTDGPAEANRLMAEDGRRWRPLQARVTRSRGARPSSGIPGPDPS